MQLGKFLPRLLLGLLLIHASLGLKVETKIETQGPKVCIWSENIIPKNIASMCKHRGLWYVAGQFNRFADQQAKSFVVLDEDFNLMYRGEVGSNSRLELVRQHRQRKLSNERKNYLSTISKVICDEQDDYVYIAGMFRNVTNPWNPEDLLAFEKKQEEDSSFVFPDPPEIVVNNIARFNVTSRRFEAMGPTLKQQNWTSGEDIGATRGNDWPLIRSMECVGTGRYKCDKMNVGGTFNKLFGQWANGLATFEVTRLEEGNPRKFEVASVEEIESVSSGVVMTTLKLSNGVFFYGGIFGPEENSGTSAPPSIKLLTPHGPKCPISVAMQELPQCKKADAPYLCCENFFGPAFTSLRVGPEEFLVGGDFSNPLEFEYSGQINGLVPWAPSDGIPPEWTNPGKNPFTNFTDTDFFNDTFGGTRRRHLADGDGDTAAVGLGYQNIIMVPIPFYTDEGGLRKQNVTTRWNGGPNGPVIDMSCKARDESLDRCVDILIAGEFTQWDEFTIDSEFEQSSTTLVYTPGGACRLKWSYDTESYYPVPLVNPENLNEEDYNFLGDVQSSSGKISAIYADESGVVVAGGTFSHGNNLFAYNSSLIQDHFESYTNSTNAFSSLPKTAVPIRDDNVFYGCMVDAYNKREGVGAYVGADFCCPKGSYCQEDAIDMPCSDGWGWHCTENSVDACEEGYYCPTPGDKLVCPVGSYCKQGATKPVPCVWFEVCSKPGLIIPEQASGFVFAAFTVGFLLFCLFVGSRWVMWSQKRGKWSIEKHFHERFNAFKATASGKAVSDDKSKHDGIEIKGISTAPALGGPSFHDTGSGSLSARERATSFTPPDDCRIDLTFTDLTVTLANGLKILNGVSGELKSGTMTAIMGPSGCGKSTFMNALTYRIRDGGKVGGEVLVNGEKRHLMTIQHVVGFVPQEDTMHRDLSVRENLRFYLKLKGNPNLSRVQRRSFLNEIIDILGLAHVQHSLIGDELRRGVSGGQRKRVNIGIELMGSPLLLFLDEPTSGLDATTSQQLIESLETLTELGLTVAMVIHQPRIELLNKIQNLVLLQRGGWPVYVGPTQEALPYIEDYLGQKLPAQTSPADFFLDIITLDQKIDDDGEKVLKLPHGKDMHENWVEYVKTKLPNGKVVQTKKSEMGPRRIPPRTRPSRLRQTQTYYLRSVRQIQNNIKMYFLDMALLLFAGTLAGFVAKNIMVGMQMVMTVNGLIGIMNALRVFGPEKAVFRREMQSGISSIAYFTGKIMSQIPILLITPWFFLATYYRLSASGTDMHLTDMYIIIVCLLVSATGIGYFLSLLVSPQNAQIAGVVFGLIAIMTCGMNPTLRDLEATSFGAAMCALTYGPKTMGALFLTIARRVFKAGFRGALDSSYYRGYHDIPYKQLYTEEDIYDARIELKDRIKSDLFSLLTQGLVYMIISYFVILYLAKAEIGGFFVQITQSRPVRVVAAACEKFWFGKKKTRLEEDEEEEPEKNGDDVIMGKSMKHIPADSV